MLISSNHSTIFMTVAADVGSLRYRLSTIWRSNRFSTAPGARKSSNPGLDGADHATKSRAIMRGAFKKHRVLFVAAALFAAVGAMVALATRLPYPETATPQRSDFTQDAINAGA